MVNSVLVKIDSKDYNVKSGSIDYSLDKVSTFSLSILASELINWRNIDGTDVEVFSNGVSLISGIVDKPPKLKIDDNSMLFVDIKCIDELGRLTFERAKSDAHYQDQQVVGIISDLMTSVAANWSVTTVNMVDPLIETTIDLRNKETLFGQISEAIRSVPNLHFRYGGFNTTTSEYILEIGDFGDVTERAEQGSNLLKIDLQYSTNKVFETVEAFGDLTPTTRISLSDALSDARTILHSDYAQFPISQDPITLVYICTNTAITNGRNVRKSLNVIKTRNDISPTAAQIAEAGYALWLKTVRFMKGSINTEDYSGTYISQNIPKVGDKMRIKSEVTEPIYDHFSGVIVDKHVTFSVDDDFRITKIKHNLGEIQILHDILQNNFEGNFNVFDFQTTSSDEAEINDPELELYERLERFDNYDDASSSLEVFPVQITAITFGNADASDCGTGTGKTYLHTTPAYPAWVTQVQTWYTTDNGGIATGVLPPAALGNNWTACVKTAGGTWPPVLGADITVTVFWLFT